MASQASQDETGAHILAEDSGSDGEGMVCMIKESFHNDMHAFQQDLQKRLDDGEVRDVRGLRRH